MNKLIKLAPDHYVVVEDAPLTEPYPKIVLEKLTTGKWTLFQIDTLNDVDSENQRRITHSFGKLLEGVINRSLSEVEDAIFGHNVDKMASDYCLVADKLPNKPYSACYIGFQTGFKANQELVKDKLFTIDDIKKAFNAAWILGQKKENNLTDCMDNFIQTISPQTEWNIEFDEQGKIIII